MDDILNGLAKFLTPDRIGIGISWVALIVGFCQLKDLRLRNKRIESPSFDFHRLLVLVPSFSDGKGGFVPCFDSPPNYGEVPDNYSDGDPVRIFASNKGGESRLTEVLPASGLPVERGQQERISGENDLDFGYQYSKSRKGKKEKIRIRYETISGEKGEQIFEFSHGCL